MPVPKRDSETKDQQLSKLYRYVVISISLTYLLGAVFYADTFHFWQHALSELGTTRPLLGTPNLLSAFLVVLGMFITGWFLVEIALIYQNHHTIANHYPKSWLSCIAGIGSFIAIFPNDLFHVIHSIGIAMMIGPIFFLELIILWEMKSIVGPRKAYLVITVLSASVLTYAAAFFHYNNIQQVSQKFCIFNLLVVLFQRSKFKREYPNTFHIQHQM